MRSQEPDAWHVEVLLITTTSPAVVCGRDGPVALRLAHVSKARSALRGGKAKGCRNSVEILFVTTPVVFSATGPVL